MPFTPMAELLLAARDGGYAVPAFCVWNAETAEMVLQVTARMQAPVILLHGPGEASLFPFATMSRIVQLFLRDHHLPVAICLDHGGDMAQVADALDAGYSAVMLDYSARPYAENAAALRDVVALARPRGVTVEGEIGHVGRVDKVVTEGVHESTLTDPAEAAAYVAETGIDALAVSIGNGHGLYTKLPRLDFDRLAEIAKTVTVPLVLHGGSGTPDADLKRAIGLGITKVNVASDLIAAVRNSLMRQWSEERNLWAPMAMREAVLAMAPVVEGWLIRTGAAGRA